jgi:diguanylate cyclase
MPSDSLEVLGLRGVAPASPVHEARSQILGQVLERLSAIKSGDADFEAAFVKCRAELTNSADAESTTRAGATLLELLERLLAASPQGEASRELARAVQLVRDLIGSVADEGASDRQELAGVTERLSGLQKNHDIHTLRACLAQEVDRLKDVTTRREARWRDVLTRFERRVSVLEERLASTLIEASYDELTGLANRRNVAARFADLARQRRRVVLALLDIDNFKVANETLGHVGADSVLQDFAKLLERSIRSTDVVGRFGGDEFIILLLDVSLAQAESRFRTLQHQLAGHTDSASGRFSLSFSCGLSEYAAGDTLDSLTKRADQALFKAKKLGKTRIVAEAAPFIRDLLKAPRPLR